ncbi:MAG: DUF11 domain-containing protein [Verrucomicrobiales bacterium]|jgi:uncharacterized repeat protein (TIGR01451 family)|nr:DUF11 domain-containing protein [Verrucomicrobiales bacterium]
MKQSLVKNILALGFAVIIGGCAGTNQSNYLQHYSEFVRDGVTYSQCSAAYPTGFLDSSAVRMDKIVPKQALVGKEYNYQFIVTNLRGQDLTNVVITDELPASFKIVSSNPKPTTSGNQAKWLLPVLKANEKLVIDVVGSAPATGKISSCGYVSYDDQVCATTDVVQAGLKVKVTAPKTASLCDIIPLVYTVTNIGSIPLDNVIVDGGKTSDLEALDGTRGGHTPVGTLQPGESKQIEIQAKAPKTGNMYTAIRGISNTVVSEEDKVLTVVSASALKVKITGPGEVIQGRSATYNIVVTNSGNGPANQTVVTSPVPAGSQFSVASGTAAVGKDDYIVWPAVNIPAGGNVTYSFTVIPTSSPTVNASATAQDNCSQSVSDKAVTNVKGVAAVHLGTIDSPDPIQVGETTVYTITALNQGFAKDTNIKIRCEVGELEEIVAVAGDTKGTFDAKTATFSPYPVLEPKQKATWTITVKGLKKGDAVFKAYLKTDQFSVEVLKDEPTTIY